MVNAIYHWLEGNEKLLETNEIRVLSRQMTEDSSNCISVRLERDGRILDIYCWEKGDFEDHYFSGQGSEVSVCYEKVTNPEEAVHAFKKAIARLQSPKV